MATDVEPTPDEVREDASRNPVSIHRCAQCHNPIFHGLTIFDGNDYHSHCAWYAMRAY